MKHKISIIVPVYNVEKYIRKCIDSIVNQEYINQAEIILVDDGSTDSSGTVCDEYKTKYLDLIEVIHKPNGGLSSARNVGLKHSNGEYIFFIDSDDTIADNALEIILKALTDYDSPDMLIFDARTVDEDGNILNPRICGGYIYYRVPTCKKVNIYDEKELIFEHHSAWSRVVKREIYISNNIQFPEGLWYEDIGTTPKLLICSPVIVHIGQTLYNYLQRKGSIMNSHNTDRMSNDIMTEFEIIIKWFKEMNLFDEFYHQLEYMTIDKLLLIQCVKMIDKKSSWHHIKNLQSFTSSNFKYYKRNNYLESSKKINLLKVYMLHFRLYRLLSLMYKIRNFLKR